VLKYFTYKVVFFILAFPLAFASWNSSYWWVWIILFVTLFITGLFLGSVYIGSGFYIDVVCRALPEQRAIALTFDDGPHPDQTEKVLEVLRKHDIKACFFCIGKNADAYKDLLKKIDAEGHIIGNHSFSHAFWFDLFPLKKMREEIVNTNILISEVIGKNMRLFRPPYGVTTPNLAKAIKRTGMVPVGWSLRTFDTVAKGDIKKISKKLNRVKPGDVVLFHDHSVNLPEILNEFIIQLKKNNIEIIRFDELTNIKAYV